MSLWSKILSWFNHDKEIKEYVDGQIDKFIEGSIYNKNDVLFEKAVKFVLLWEGGYVNDKNDPGGETKYGISKKSYPDLDIKSITTRIAKDIYKRDYWDKSGCNGMKWPVNLAVFDASVNLGVKRSGIIYNKIDKINDSVIFALNIVKEREKFYNKLATRKSKYRRYMKGWLNRTHALKQLLLKGAT